MSNDQIKAGINIILAIILGLLINIVTGGNFIPLGPAWFLLVVVVVIELVLAMTSNLQAARRLLIFFSLVALIVSGIVWVNPLNLPKISVNSSSPSKVSIPYPPFKGELLYNDPLNGPYLWSATTANDSCEFVNGKYLVITDGANECVSQDLKNQLHSFAFEVKLTVLKNDGSGVVAFEGNNFDPLKARFYRIAFYQGGYEIYYAYAYEANNEHPWGWKALDTQVSSLAPNSWEKTHTIGVVVNEKTIDLYVDYKKFGSYYDGPYDHGSHIAFGGLRDSDALAHISYSDAKVWSI